MPELLVDFISSPSVLEDAPLDPNASRGNDVADNDTAGR
jgi:hypothetical protein